MCEQTIPFTSCLQEMTFIFGVDPGGCYEGASACCLSTIICTALKPFPLGLRPQILFVSSIGKRFHMVCHPLKDLAIPSPDTTPPTSSVASFVALFLFGFFWNCSDPPHIHPKNGIFSRYHKSVQSDVKPMRWKDLSVHSMTTNKDGAIGSFFFHVGSTTHRSIFHMSASLHNGNSSNVCKQKAAGMQLTGKLTFCVLQFTS